MGLITGCSGMKKAWKRVEAPKRWKWALKKGKNDLGRVGWLVKTVKNVDLSIFSPTGC